MQLEISDTALSLYAKKTISTNFSCFQISYRPSFSITNYKIGSHHTEYKAFSRARSVSTTNTQTINQFPSKTGPRDLGGTHTHRRLAELAQKAKKEKSANYTVYRCIRSSIHRHRWAPRKYTTQRPENRRCAVAAAGAGR